MSTGAPGRIRTDTRTLLRGLPLPIGLRGREGNASGPGIGPAAAGRAVTGLAHPTGGPAAGKPSAGPVRGSTAAVTALGRAPAAQPAAATAGQPAAATSVARERTASSIGSVSLPVKVFCWLTW